MDTGARSSRLTSSRPRGITLELTPMSFSKSQESLCTPTGQGRGATFQRQLTPPKKEKEAQATLPLLLIWPAALFLPERQLLCVRVCWQNICHKLPFLDCLNALTP